MKIVDFTYLHIERAMQIAKRDYETERGFVPDLPVIPEVPDLTRYAGNNLGVAAFEGAKMVGFLCCVKPFQHAFGSTDAVGVFSPMGANGSINENRAEIYALMVQAAAEKWARAGVSSHAVCLYAHDTAVQQQFFRYGYGMRCIDAIRGMDEIEAPLCPEYQFSELKPKEFLEILPLDHLLDAHMAASPTFILRPSETAETFLKKAEHFKSIFFAAKQNGQMVAFIRAELDGETFVCNTPGYLHVKGALCLPEHRGKGIHKTLLSMLIHKLKTQGYTRLGVDFESINPTAYGFWLKYFNAYTHSVVRRIDEHAINKVLMEK